MGLLDPRPPPYDPLEWRALPYPERARAVCQAWASQGYGTPPAAFAAYGLKVLAYVGGWIFFCSFSPEIEGLSDLGRWWLTPVAFQKAVLWSMLFEVLGLGCGSGPLTGRYLPPFGGVLHFARLGTTKLPFSSDLPVLGGPTRGVLDVGLYAVLLFALVFTLIAATPPFELMIVVVVVLPVLGLADQTIYLAARSEHYLVATFCFLYGTDWVAGAKIIWLGLWFWAGVSKLNAHFPSVVCVMQSNSPLQMPGLRTKLYRHFPDDLRPSRIAVRMAHFGTFLELSVPVFLGLGSGGPLTVVGFGLMLVLHGFITGSVPMGVPIEWNVIVVYGAFFLFGTHAEVSVFEISSPVLSAVLLVSCVGLPLYGNLFPRRVSFLLSMRYYAGNWPFSVWLFRDDAYRKLDRVKKSSPWVMDQLAHFYDQPTALGLFGKVLAFRSMHLHGRILQLLLPRAVERFEDYEYVDGEVVAGLVLGYNFGDGHLHQERLLETVQAQCRFEPGELRCIFVESQALLGRSLGYRIHDAADGIMDAGEVPISDLQRLQPWPSSRCPTPRAD